MNQSSNIAGSNPPIWLNMRRVWGGASNCAGTACSNNGLIWLEDGEEFVFDTRVVDVVNCDNTVGKCMWITTAPLNPYASNMPDFNCYTGSAPYTCQFDCSASKFGSTMLTVFLLC